MSQLDCESFQPNPRGEAWLSGAGNVGRRILEKQGWTQGKGLGAKEQGMKECIRVTQKQNRHGFGRNVAEESATALRDCHDSFASVLSHLHAVHASEQSEQASVPAETVSADDEEDEKQRRRRERKEKKRRQRELESADCASEADVRSEKSEDLARPVRDGEQRETIARSSSTMSLYEVASRRKRIHYARYTRSKDVSRLTGEDFRGVFGKPDEIETSWSKSKNETTEIRASESKNVEQSSSKQSETADDETVSGTPLFKSEKSIAEYFAEKKRQKLMQSSSK